MKSDTRRKSRTSYTSTVETYTLTLITKGGKQSPIGPGGAATFHPFHDWTKACEATAAAVGQLAGIGVFVAAVTVVTTQMRDGRMLMLTLRKFEGDVVKEMRGGGSANV